MRKLRAAWRLLAIALALILLSSVIAPADDRAFLSRMIVFGDSLSDTGSLSTLTDGSFANPPYFEQRFSNGPVWVDRLADRLGLAAPVASLDGGTNFAYAGAQTGAGLAFGFIPNVEMQIDEFFLTGDTLDGDDLIVLWAGANDSLQFVQGASGFDPETVVGNSRFRSGLGASFGQAQARPSPDRARIF